MPATDYLNGRPDPDFDRAAATAKETKQEFARRLSAELRKRGWNQSDLARRAKLNRDLISNYVRAKSLPGDQKMTAICGALNCEPEDLLPASSIRKVDDDGVSLMVRESPIAGQVMFRLNKQLPFSKALKIMRILEEPDENDGT